MSGISSDIVVTSRVRLARNYYDLPFSILDHPANAQICIDRAREAFPTTETKESYRLNTLRELSATERMALVEKHLISRDLLQSSGVGAALVRGDQAVSIMVNEEDHLRIQALLPGLRLEEAATLAFEAEEHLQQKCAFSFDPQLGYLTACPTNTGTGMRASLMLHLPLLTHFKQMGNVTQSVAKLGLTIRGIYGEGSDALGDLYQVSNQVTLGRMEQEIMEAVLAVGKQLIGMEKTLRRRASGESGIGLQDRVFRSYGILRYARQMDAAEFMQHWSNLRLGITLGLIPVELSTVDELLTIAQDAHAKLYRNSLGTAMATDLARSEIIRSKLNSTPQEV